MCLAIFIAADRPLRVTPEQKHETHFRVTELQPKEQFHLEPTGKVPHSTHGRKMGVVAMKATRCLLGLICCLSRRSGGGCRRGEQNQGYADDDEGR